MAEIKKDIQNMEFPLQLARQYGAPLDKYEVFYSMAEAEDYAKNSPLAYVGQIIRVLNEDDKTIHCYQIGFEGELKELSYIDGIYPDMTVGKATNADKADKATKDGNGNDISSTYMPKTGGAFTGSITANQVTGARGVYDNTERVWSANNRPTATEYNTSSLTSRNEETDTVVSYYRTSDGSTWYRIWSSGWKECGGYIKLTNTLTYGTGTDLQIAFPLKFASANYTSIVTQSFGSLTESTSGAELGTNTKTVSSMKIRVYNRNGSTNISANMRVDFYCCGY